MRTLTMALRLMLVPSIVLVGACGGDDDTTSVATSPAIGSTVSDASSPESSTPRSGANDTVLAIDDPAEEVGGEAPQDVVDELIERVSRETGVDRDDIVVVRAFSKVWSDGSLGCGEPGMVYQQLEIAGHQVELEADGQSWDFRVGNAGEVIRCEPGS